MDSVVWLSFLALLSGYCNISLSILAIQLGHFGWTKVSCASQCPITSWLRSRLRFDCQKLQPEMVVLSANTSAFLHQGIPLLQSKFPASSATKVDYHQVPSLTSRTVSLTNAQYSYRNHIGSKTMVSATRNDRQLSINDELFQEPFLLTMIKETIWGIKSLFTFLVEQPSQLKYIEWPSFSNTLRTATLTLVLVALLIVALSSVDSALCYLLALVLRKAS